MVKFIRWFIVWWRYYPAFIEWFNHHFTDEEKKAFANSDAKKGIKPYKSRFDFAYRNAKIEYLHRGKGVTI